jgi:zinc transporter 1/2/3
MNAWIIKLSTMIIMFLMVLITGNLPLRLKSFKSNPLVLSLTSAFSGGLFLAVGVIHLLPEANENFENALSKDKENFPWAFAITIMSFALILFIEKVATDSH